MKKIFNIDFKKIFEKVNKQTALSITGIVSMVLLVIVMVVVTAVSTTPSDDAEKEPYTYIGFTLEEKVSISKLIGDSIPFISTNEYYFENEENSIRFYTVGNNEEDFSAYQQSVISSGFKLASWDDEKGFGYEKGNTQLFLKSYKEDNKFIINVILTLKDGTSNGGNNGDGGNTGNGNNGGNTSTSQTISYPIGSSMPNGLTYITNDSKYPNPDFGSAGGWKLRFEGMAVETATFSAANSVKVTLEISQLNPNDKTGTSSNYFTITGLNASGNVVDTKYLTTVQVGSNDVTLSGEGIVKVKIAFTGFPYNGTKYLNPVITNITLDLNANGSNQGGSNNGGNSGNQGGSDTDDNGGATQYANTDFTSSEKNIINGYFGFSIPFIPNNDYTFDEFIPSEDEISGIYYYAEINTQAEFETYKTAILNSGFTFGGTEVDDEYGDTWYIYTKNDVFLDVTCFLYEGSYWVEVHAYKEIEDGGSGDSGNQGGTNPSTSAIQAILDEASTLSSGASLSGDRTVTGTVKSIEEEYTTEYKKISFILTDGVAEILVHRATGDCAESLKVGDTVTVKGTVINYKGTVIEFQYPKLSNHIAGSSNDDLITNDGAGLPTETDGVYDVDFTEATNVKKVTDLGDYIDGCPTEGDVKVLVIPVEFSDITASSKGYDINKINLAFNGTGNDTDYRSVSEYYFESSNGKLDLDFYVYNSWFKPKNASTYYANQTMDYYGDDIFIGDQLVMDEALAYLSTVLNLKDFDSDGNGCIDAVVLITTLEIDSSTDFNWAYRYWNLYTDEYEYDNVSANDYLWASYQFLYETENQEFTDEDAMNTYTFIHEFGHVLGVDDYYDYSEEENHPLDGADIMDITIGDHNPFSKINLGWITTSRLVVADSSIQLTLKDFSSTGDTIIIANNWDPTLGAYQEYYILMYYTHTGLNEDGLYFVNEGIVMYHVNASLYSEEYDGEIYYNIYNSNSDPSYAYGTYDNLIELCKSSTNTYVHTVGVSSSANLTDDLGNKISYTFTVDSLTSAEATITFTKNN